MKSWFPIAAAAVAVSLASPARAQDPLLEETVNFTGAVLYYSLGVPGLVIGAVRNGETAVAGFGRVSDDVDRAPSPRSSPARFWQVWWRTGRCS
jgi:D-alanyl-D-alanine-carboxypeptidase/D-alanyl-D-alanine-endopeptidase